MMPPAQKTVAAACIALHLTTGAASAQDTDQDITLDAMADYAGFATYEAGIILPKQITDDVMNGFVFIDTRTAEEFSESTIKGARHIEWRDIFSRMDDIPQDRPTVLFCNSGALSAQAAFGLRVLGYDNVLILQTGFAGWQAHHAAVEK